MRSICLFYIANLCCPFSPLILLDGIHLLSVCVYACLYVSTCIWKPKVDTECFPPPLYTFYIKEGSLLNLELTIVWLASSLHIFVYTSCTLGLQADYYTSIYISSEDLSSSPHTCPAGAVPIEATSPALTHSLMGIYIIT